jgi:hypothetical protein
MDLCSDVRDKVNSSSSSSSRGAVVIGEDSLSTRGREEVAAVLYIRAISFYSCTEEDSASNGL